MNFNIAKLPGDGIGPEIVEQAVKVLDAIGSKYNHHFNYKFAFTRARAIDQGGNPYP